MYRRLRMLRKLTQRIPSAYHTHWGSLKFFSSTGTTRTVGRELGRYYPLPRLSRVTALFIQLLNVAGPELVGSAIFNHTWKREKIADPDPLQLNTDVKWQVFIKRTFLVRISMNRQPGRQVAGRRKELDRVDWEAEGKGVFEGVGKDKLYRPSPVLWSRSVFERLRIFFFNGSGSYKK